VAWSRVTRPQELGGLGVLDLTTLGYVLQLRWSWLARTDPGLSWSALPAREEPLVCAMFEASTTVQVDNGRCALFWQDRWLDGTSIRTLAPSLCRVVCARTRTSRLVCDALQDDRWIMDIEGALDTVALDQYVRLWCRLQEFHLATDGPDRFIWKWSPNQHYSSSSIYTRRSSMVSAGCRRALQDQGPSELQVLRLASIA
jgi:hypothetical protein